MNKQNGTRMIAATEQAKQHTPARLALLESTQYVAAHATRAAQQEVGRGRNVMGEQADIFAVALPYQQFVAFYRALFRNTLQHQMKAIERSAAHYSQALHGFLEVCRLGLASPRYGLEPLRHVGISARKPTNPALLLAKRGTAETGRHSGKVRSHRA